MTGKGPAGKRRPFPNSPGRHGKGLIGVCGGIWGVADTGRGGSVDGWRRFAGQTRRAADWWPRRERIVPDCVIPDSGCGIDQEVH